MVHIEEITKLNFWDVCELTSNKNGIAIVLEEHVCCNAYSIAESHYYPEYIPKALYWDDKLIGFFMYKIVDEQPTHAFICRFMLDYKYLGKGLGKQSFSAILVYLNSLGIRRISLGLDEENMIAKKIYCSHGFSFTGEIIDGEHIYALNL
ncbi:MULTISPECIES: GNAT family N-acetyltransferase [Providencia]|uniref:GNAT family N-acetyltransferase n=1 Tax=Providencia TaxID=586 RepID=UPI0024813909|nr:GNAT family N-acetyltransferase [Providencia rettgeri]MDU7492048.1 GNAT family N-acetyltransferase [Providencia rettgeri]HEM8304071.1 GNAT family N-acetyltransferase [Providencia rettgeri]